MDGLFILDFVYLCFVLIVFTLYYYYNPPILRSLYTTLGGRFIIVLFILFGCTINLGVGLAILLIVIVFKPLIVQEGLETMPIKNKVVNSSIAAIGAGTGAITRPGPIPAPRLGPRLGQGPGVDKISISDSLKSKSSKTLPNANTRNNDNVESFSNFSTKLTGGNF